MLKTDAAKPNVNKTYLITGAAGFIGFHLSKRLLEEGCTVVGLDNLNDYYDVSLKNARLDILRGYSAFSFIHADLADKEAIAKAFEEHTFNIVVNLAAQAGVRYGISHPDTYIGSNIAGFLNVLEACRHNKVEHLVYASSSSVYGMNSITPFSARHSVDHPVSLYAATKRSNELMAHVYSHLFGLPTTGLRFFTVYGPWGRPDMALFLFTSAVINNRPIEVYNHGDMARDFTYIDDIVEGIIRLLGRPPMASKEWDTETADPSTSSAPFRIFNIGNNQPVNLLEFIEVIEEALGRTTKKLFLPLQEGDVPVTCADVQELYNEVGFKPHTDIRTGVGKFIGWYKEYYGVDL